MKYIIKRIGDIGNVRISTRCPHCGHEGTFEGFRKDGLEGETERVFGFRRCPNEKCFGHLFFIYNNTNNKIEVLYPSITIPFERNGIPEKILNTFEEAIINHSNKCYISSAIMIRKTLEEICIEREAKGNNLFRKLENLRTKIILPQELLDGMQELRHLGNDAAHIESQTFNEIGQTEVEISIEFTKEILKAVYQYKDLLSKIRGLKKSE